MVVPAKWTIEQAHSAAREAVRRGFSGFKCSPFTFESLRRNEAGALSRAAEVVAAAREGAGPDTEIFIECSELLSPRLAVRLDDLLAPYRPGWLEEPIPFENARAMAQLQRDLRAPIATGERLLSRHETRELLERLHENLLHDVLDLVLVARVATNETKQPRLIPLHDHLEAAGLALQDGCDQLLVLRFHRGHCDTDGQFAK